MLDLTLLSDTEVRVLGALIEKEITTPEYYPLSLNGLTNACNQINNRDPVVAYAEADVSRALESLRDKHLAYVTTGGTSRVVKFGHKFREALELDRAAVAALAVLMLRGPQTVGEIRGRSGRMHEFADLADVQNTLSALAGRTKPLVVLLPRQPGTKEPRYAHLLCGEPVVSASPAASPVAPPVTTSPVQPDRLAALEAEIVALRREVAELRGQIATLRPPGQ